MGDVTAPSLDEVQYRNPEAVAFYGGISAENVHLYFLSSPFCEATSNNQFINNQANFNPALYNDLVDRTKFEARLEKMNGVEYRIVDGPSVTTPDMNPVWVFRKQNREKQSGQPDKLTTLGTYFAIQDAIYQAPSLRDIINSRLMAVTYLLDRFQETLYSTLIFDPSTGRSYYPSGGQPTPKPSFGSTRTSRANSPVADNTPQASQSQQVIKDIPQEIDDRSIYDSFKLSMQYGSEYMDENPLIGEPGSFVLSSTSRNLKDQREKAVEAAKPVEHGTSRTPSVAPAAEKLVERPRKATDASKLKSPISAATDAGIKKNRKIKAPGTPEKSPWSTKLASTQASKPISPRMA